MLYLDLFHVCSLVCLTIVSSSVICFTQFCDIRMHRRVRKSPCDGLELAFFYENEDDAESPLRLLG